jgi:DNA-binding response OmpR family regulator
MYEARKRILVVEDERAIQQVLCFFLEHNGFEVLGVCGGQDAIYSIPEFLPDLIVLDLMMHPVSGWDVLRWLHEQPFTPAIPVLVLSALVNLKQQMSGFEHGAVEYITKPTQPSMIVERVHALLAMSTEQRVLLQHKRLDEQRKTLERLHAAQSDEFVY